MSEKVKAAELREIAIQMILAEVKQGYRTEEAVQRIVARNTAAGKDEG